MDIIDNGRAKQVRSDDYNYVFDRKTGFFVRWGTTLEDDPSVGPSPEIADIEVTTICHGPAGKVCKFCYKGNTPKGENMSFETFKDIFHRLPKTITQIAFGADATLQANPDIWKMFAYCRNNEHNIVVPNVTVANVDAGTARLLANYCGGVAVSRYADKNHCYDSVQRLVNCGMTQVVIHQLLSKETLEQARETIEDFHNDPRLKGLKAIVFLSLKPKKRGASHSSLTQEEFDSLIWMAKALSVPFGADSCSSNKLVRTMGKNHPAMVSIEPCESTCFSMYINAKGEYFPCSFAEGGCFGGAGDWSNGIRVQDFDNFSSIWDHERTHEFRQALLTNKDENNVHACPLYTI